MIDLLITEEIKEKIAENPSDVDNIINSTKEIGICITNQDKKFVAVNDYYCDLYGYKREELVGNEFTMIVPDDFKEQMNHLHDKFMKDKREISRDWQVQTRNGLLNISVDTAYSDQIYGGGAGYKITLVSKEL
ncbi:PAS domain S-box-containing protein [Marivirga sericea]|uniref:PAS domain S-box-containing protein n=1 Tax=Marivirga sericea TaxID=1028 RepID=A0A1X7JQH4_9BACT|nr:PAS domain-containing protein [Marivirga sericea]SMG29951.1 PAS domain S-box-containing protein [Marivirga sericea]